MEQIQEEETTMSSAVSSSSENKEEYTTDSEDVDNNNSSDEQNKPNNNNNNSNKQMSKLPSSKNFTFRAPQENFSIQDFELGKIYGVGSYSKVHILSHFIL